MISKVFILLLCILIANSVKVFLIGGGNDDNQVTIFSAMAQATGKKPDPSKCELDWSLTSCPRIAIITSANPTQADGNQAYQVDLPSGLSYRSLFIKYGFTPKHISVHVDNYITTTDPKSVQGQQNIQILLQADLIYFTGGSQIRHSRCWLMDNAEPNQLFKIVKSRAINNEVILIGTSAGTAVMSDITYGEGSSFGLWYFANSVGIAPKKIKDGQVNGSGLQDVRNGTRGLQHSDNAGKVQGFRLLPFQMDSHFDTRGRLGRLVPAMIDIGQTFGVGVSQSTCFYYDNGIGKVYGKSGVFTVDLSEAKKYPGTTYFKLDNIVVNLLTQGDTYDFNKKLVISSKPLIKVPYYNSATDSNDILKSGEMALLLNRLVDQKAMYNIGRTKRPSGFPSLTPTFEITFRKTSETKGYYLNYKYTVQKAVLNYSFKE